MERFKQFTNAEMKHFKDNNDWLWEELIEAINSNGSYSYLQQHPDKKDEVLEDRANHIKFILKVDGLRPWTEDTPLAGNN